MNKPRVPLIWGLTMSHKYNLLYIHYSNVSVQLPSIQITTQRLSQMALFPNKYSSNHFYNSNNNKKNNHQINNWVCSQLSIKFFINNKSKRINRKFNIKIATLPPTQTATISLTGVKKIYPPKNKLLFNRSRIFRLLRVEHTVNYKMPIRC